MARNEDAGLIEKHLEKIILGVAAVILIVAVMHWGLGSPRRIELAIDARGVRMPQKDYSPDEVDRALETASSKLEELLEGIKPGKKPLTDYVGRLKKIFENPYDDRYVHRYVDVGTGRVPLERDVPDSKVEPVKLADLLPLLKPEKPLVAVSREVQVVPPVEDRSAEDRPVVPAGPEYKEVCAAHVAMVFERGKVLKKWREVLKKTYVSAQVVFVAVEAQRRHQLPDGSWSKPEPVSIMVMPDALPLPAIPTPDEKNLLEIQQKVRELAWISNQEYILESPYYDIIWPNRQTGSWQIRNHKPRTRVSDLLGRDGEEPTTTGRTAEEERRRMLEAARRRESGRRPTESRRDREAERRRKIEMEKHRELERRLERESERRSARERPGERRPIERRPIERRPVERQPAERRPLERRPLERRPLEKRPVERRLDPDRRPVEIVAPTLILIPTLQEQLDNPAGILEVWFHDTSLTEGMTYSYRLRLVLVNPLLGRFKDAANKDDAMVQTLKTPWSDWSESVRVKRPTEFFLVGSAEQMGTVEVEVFTQRWGQRVSHRFKVGSGEPIGVDKPKKLLRLDNGEPEKVVVSFGTGAIAVSFDFKKKQRVSGTGLFRATTTEMLYLDTGGKLRTRTKLTDESSQRYKDLLREVRAASGAMAGVP